MLQRWLAHMAQRRAWSQQPGRMLIWQSFRGHELHVVPTNSTLTFEHSYTWWGEDCRSPPVQQSPELSLSFTFITTASAARLGSIAVAS